MNSERSQHQSYKFIVVVHSMLLVRGSKIFLACCFVFESSVMKTPIVRSTIIDINDIQIEIIDQYTEKMINWKLL